MWMNIYNEQIERLSSLIALIKKTSTPGGVFNGNLTGPLLRLLDKTKRHFKMLNKEFDPASRWADEAAQAFINAEIKPALQDIDNIFKRLTLK